MDLSEIGSKIEKDFNKAVQLNSASDFSNLSFALSELDVSLRETIQKISTPQMKRILDKLRKDSQLDHHELDLIKLWMVGDANHYTKLENDYNSWIGELGRLTSEIRSHCHKELTIQDAMNLRGYIHDCLRVLADVSYFLEQKKRVNQFENATREIDPQESEILVKFLEKKLSSRDL